MANRKSRALAAFLVLAAPSLAFAQVAAPPDTTVPEVPAPSNGATSSDPCAGQPGGTGADQTLSGQLQTCNGVLTPPDTGASGIQAPAPDPEPGTTPVIPPGAVPDQPANGSDSGSGTGSG